MKKMTPTIRTAHLDDLDAVYALNQEFAKYTKLKIS